MNNDEVKDLVPVEAQEQIKSAVAMCESIRELKISTDEEFESSAKVLREIKVSIDTLESKKKELTKPYKEKSSAIDKSFKVGVDALENAKSIISKAVSKYHAELEIKRIKEQLARDAAAKLAREQAQKEAEELAQKAEAYRQQGREHLAVKAEAKAEAKAEEAFSVVAEVVVENKVEGLSFREDYDILVQDKDVLLKACVENSMLSKAIVIDTGFLKKLVKTLKGDIIIPGCQIVKSSTPINRK
jgi:regulator of protease activity HflC (stomatin/prohibitin superfamily)